MTGGCKSPSPGPQAAGFVPLFSKPFLGLLRSPQKPECSRSPRAMAIPAEGRAHELKRWSFSSRGERHRHRYGTIGQESRMIRMHRAARTSQQSLLGETLGLTSKVRRLPAPLRKGTGQSPGLLWPWAQEWVMQGSNSRGH